MKTVNLRPTLHYISFILLLMFYYERYINLDVYMSLAGTSAHLATAKILSLITLVALFLSLLFGNRLTTLIALICTSFVQYESIYGADTMAYNLLL
ncbi:MAG: hypothetical protein KDD38_09625, partial [Bdellovibrionales bacterium]|nr:hypothetical protein [Bdellovibrionales bacterium]